MSRSSSQPIAASVLDRLIQPAGTGARPGGGGFGGGTGGGTSLRELKQSVRRDLENLLNTRWRARGPDEGLSELAQSLVNYGLPDLSGASLGASGNREEFRRVLAAALKRYEPRLRNVRVELVEQADALDRTLRFRIHAMLHADPAPEVVVFDSMLHPLTTTFEVKGGGR